MRADVGECGLQPHGLVGADHAALAAQGAHLLGGGERGIELPGARVEMQDALRALVVLDARIAAQLLQRVAAVGAQAHDLLDVVPRARRRAFAQELQAPQPLAHVGAQAKEQGASSRPSHFSTLNGAPGLAQGSAWLTEICPPLAKLVSAPGTPWRSVTVTSWPALQEVGGGGAEQAGTENDHAHDSQAFWKVCTKQIAGVALLNR